MRALALALLLLAAPLAGCLSGEDASTDDGPSGPGSGPGDGDGAGDDGNGTGSQDEGPRPAPLPSLGPGAAWTYESTGLWNVPEDLTIVVARASSKGYLFAGGAPIDLVEDVHWNRTWLGPQTLELNPRGGDEEIRLFDFPISDGKTWSSRDGTVTAEATTLETPLGTFEGYQMTLEGTDTNATWTYAPRVGYLVTYTAELGDQTVLDLALKSVQARENATWYTAHGRALALGGPSSGSIEVPSEANTVSIVAGGRDGGQVTVFPPATSQQAPWTFEAEGEERWIYDRRPPAEGTWRMTVNHGPSGYAGGGIAAVNWTTLDVGYR